MATRKTTKAAAPAAQKAAPKKSVRAPRPKPLGDDMDCGADDQWRPLERKLGRASGGDGCPPKSIFVVLRDPDCPGVKLLGTGQTVKLLNALADFVAKYKWYLSSAGQGESCDSAVPVVVPNKARTKKAAAASKTAKPKAKKASQPKKAK